MSAADIIRMASEAGMGGMLTDVVCSLSDLERFAALVAAAEREDCAKVCEDRIGGAVQSNEWWNGFKASMRQCAAVIRARGNGGKLPGVPA